MKIKFLLFLATSSLLASPQLSKHREAQLPEEAFRIDRTKKRDTTVQLVKKAIEFLLKNRPEQAFHAFLTDRRFIAGDIHLFVYDTKGTTYLRWPVSEIWGSRKLIKDAYGLNPFELLLNKANAGGGWVDYESNGEYKSSYVEKVEKGGITYLIGAGWFPMDKRSAVISLVKNAVNFFTVHGRKRAFDEFNNQFGQFVRGDLYIYSYDTKGYCFADGDNTALVGRNLIDLKDDQGRFIIKGLIDVATKGTHWTDYTWKNAPKKGYAELVSDESGEYIIGAGYYPDSARTLVADLVKRATQYFNAWGKEKAAAVFSYHAGEFVYGDVTIFMYDYTGKVIANGDNPKLVGENLFDLHGPGGQPIVQQMIELAKAGGGWISYPWKNDWIVSYIEPVKDKRSEYLIGAGYFPGSPRERTLQLVRDATGYIKNRTIDIAFRDFMNPRGTFSRGLGLELFVFNAQGDCLVYTNDSDKIWQNFQEYKDGAGQKIFPQFVKQSQSGGGWVKYQSRGTQKMAYIDKVEKDGQSYILGGAFYL